MAQQAKVMSEKMKRKIVEEFIGEDLEKFVEENLGIDWVQAVRGTLTPYIKKLIKRSLYFNHQKKGRTDLQLVQEIIFSRCIELKLISEFADRVVLHGSDKENLITRIANNNPDFWEVGTNNFFEVVSNYHGLFVNKENFYISKNKVLNLCSDARYMTIYLLAVDVLYKSYCFVKVLPDMEEMKYISEEEGVDGYRVSLKGQEWISLGEINYTKEKVGKTDEE